MRRSRAGGTTGAVHRAGRRRSPPARSARNPCTVVGRTRGFPRNPARTAATNVSVGVPGGGVGDGDAAGEARLLAGDECEPGQEVRGAQGRRLVAGEELLEPGVGGDDRGRARIVARHRLHLVRVRRGELLDDRCQRGALDDELAHARALQGGERRRVERSGQRGARVDVGVEEALEGRDATRRARSVGWRC